MKKGDGGEKNTKKRANAKIVTIEQALELAKPEQLFIEQISKKKSKPTLEHKTKPSAKKNKNTTKNLEQNVEQEVPKDTTDQEESILEYKDPQFEQAYQRALRVLYQESSIDYAAIWGFDTPTKAISDQYLEHARLEDRQDYGAHSSSKELGMLTQGNAHAIAVRMANMKLFGDVTGISVEEREKYDTWQKDISNKVLRNIWHSSNPIQYNGNFLPMIHK